MVDLHLFLGRPLKEAQKDSQAQDDGLIGTVPQQFVDDEQNFLKAAHDKSHDLVSDRDWPFPSSPGPLFQSEAKYKTIDVKMSFNFHGNKTHFHKKGFALSLVFKERVFGTRKCPIDCLPCQLPQAINPLDSLYDFVNFSGGKRFVPKSL